MKKVLFVNSSLGSGGSERVMTLLANEFASRDYEVTMFLIRENIADVYPLDEKINCIRFKYKFKSKIFIAVSRILRMHRLIKKNQYDVVISFMHDVNYMTALSCIGCKLKLIISERADPNNRQVSFFIKLLEKFSFKKAEKIVFQTNDVMKEFSEKVRKKGIVIPNPVNSTIEISDFKKRKKEIIAVGRFTEQKNFKMLIEAFEKIHKEDKYKEYKLYIYGDGPLRLEFAKLIAEKGLENDILIPGFCNNIIEKMKKSYIYVSSSNFEGISNSMIEAMAMGLPVICTDCPVGGAALMIRHRKNGILIPVGDVECLYRELKELLDNEKIAIDLGRNAKKIRIEYSVEKIANIWEKIM